MMSKLRSLKLNSDQQENTKIEDKPAKTGIDMSSSVLEFDKIKNSLEVRTTVDKIIKKYYLQSVS